MNWSARLGVDEIDLAEADLAVVVGPTASGKSDLAIALAEARGGEIIGADSVQVYRRFDIGSGKPSPSDRSRVTHHMIDVADPLEPMDAASYAVRATEAIADARRRGKLPIVCGGTFLWVRALLYGLSSAPTGDPVIRQRHASWAEDEGRAALHAKLATVDPDAASRLDPNDFVRVSRALEVFELTGRPLSLLHKEHGFRQPRFKARLIGIGWTADELVARIAERTERLLAAGFVEEVAELSRLGYRDARAMASVGYKQVLDCVEGRLAKDDLAPAINRATKVFARRQRTWLREEPVLWLDHRKGRGSAID
jgi:tRNA dimethylallyltransferase